MKRMVVILTSIIFLTACSTNSPSSHTDHSQQHHSTHTDHNQNQSSEQEDHIKVAYSFKEGKAEANKDTVIQIHVQDEKGKPIERFDTTHEKKLHLIVVSKDLHYFNHIHPELKGKGLFEVTTRFPAGGEYKLFSDFVPTGGTATTKSEWVKVEGKPSASVSIQPDQNWTKSVNGKEITLETDRLQAGKETMLTFMIKDDQTKKPITNLEQYLGAVGHVVIITKDTNKYLHVHPMEEKATGPDAKFMTTFPQRGIYKIWAQFQHEGKVITVPFVVNVS
ncbi:hypothetical protein MK805_14230 [Shimazuella sp. AN120528]|uniref:hypothetical protein n=1 Tax=Shimazuella soli TaxID=1892854 RepID=UPI001F0FDB90|nr:hypothetical protein [Shimazuella soli]MCH5586096.1 hypothetical protein [Shimazuella soli]